MCSIELEYGGISGEWLVDDVWISEDVSRWQAQKWRNFAMKLGTFIMWIHRLYGPSSFENDLIWIIDARSVGSWNSSAGRHWDDEVSVDQSFVAMRSRSLSWSSNCEAKSPKHDSMAQETWLYLSMSFTGPGLVVWPGSITRKRPLQGSHVPCPDFEQIRRWKALNALKPKRGLNRRETFLKPKKRLS